MRKRSLHYSGNDKRVRDADLRPFIPLLTCRRQVSGRNEQTAPSRLTCPLKPKEGLNGAPSVGGQEGGKGRTLRDRPLAGTEAVYQGVTIGANRGNETQQSTQEYNGDHVVTDPQ